MFFKSAFSSLYHSFRLAGMIVQDATSTEVTVDTKSEPQCLQEAESELLERLNL